MSEIKAWQKADINALYELPFFELIYKAHWIGRENFPAQDMELATLLNIKTGACPEDCGYCSQSGHYDTGLKKEKLWDLQEVIERAQAAKQTGAVRFCMGAAWRHPPAKDFPKVLDMIKAVKKIGLEACVTLGTLSDEQAKQLKEAGLDFYNHNLDTSPEHYKKIISTRTYAERIETIHKVHAAGLNMCCGGIMGMGETRDDRIEFFLQLLQLPDTLTSVPINRLMHVAGTPLEHVEPIENFEFIRTVAVARILFPKARVRLTAGRDTMSEEMQAWCFMAGANSMFIGEKLLTEPNPDLHQDFGMLKKLNIRERIADYVN